MTADLAATARTVGGTAAAGGRLFPRGAGSWWPDVPEGAEVLDLSPFAQVARFDAADLVATAGAGCALDRLAARLASGGTWLALDPPGPAGRSLGGALSAGGGGPLAAGYGPPRDQVLGMTLIAGNGTVVRTGGRVVKNVAGFDLAKVIVGGHGAFGAIVEAHLRLRATPEADRSRAWAGRLETVVAASRALLEAGAAPAALEVLSPDLAEGLGTASEWVLALRAIGTRPAVEEELEATALALQSLRGCREVALPPDVWARWREVVGSWPIVLRIGADPSSWAEAVALAERHLGLLEGASATVPRGTVRAGTRALEPATASSMRAEAARRGWPITLERAPSRTRTAVGIWGAVPPGPLRLMRALRDTFDPAGVFAVPLLA